MVNIEPDELNDLQFSPDERFVAVSNSNIQLVALDHRNNSFLRTDRRKYGTIRFNNSGTRLLTINAQSEIELIDIKSRVAVKRFCCSSFYGEVSFSENYTQVINAGHWPRIWTTSGEIVGNLAADRQFETFRPITIDEIKRVVFMGSQDGRVYAWSLDDLGLLKRSPAQNNYVDTMAIIPKIQKIAYCGFGKRLRLWSVAVDSDVELSNLTSSSNRVALPDGKSILFGTNQGTVETWDLEASPHLTSTLSPVRPI
jgi:WD40 repeat protein